MIGSPIVRLRSTDQGKLKIFAVINLNILFTLMLYVELEKNKVAFRALAYVLAYTTQQFKKPVNLKVP